MKTRQVTITNITYITPIQMDGPIVTPMTLSESIVRDLVRRGYNVLQEVNGTQVKLTPFNFNNPEASIHKPKSFQANTKVKVNEVPEKRFEKNAPVIAANPTSTPKPPKPIEKTESTPIDYDFGKEVENVNIAITPDEEAVGRLFTGRSIPDVSPNVVAVTGVDDTQEGTIEAGKMDNVTENKKSDSNPYQNSRSNNRLQNKRKHKK